MDKWDSRFLAQARQVATWSKDPSTQVGAVLVSPDHKHISTGYNGFPKGIEDTEARLSDRDTKNTLVLHAEANAILNACTNLSEWTMYVTFSPCVHCALMIIQAGVKRVVVLGSLDPNNIWYQQSKSANRLFIEAGVSIEYDMPACYRVPAYRVTTDTH